MVIVQFAMLVLPKGTLQCHQTRQDGKSPTSMELMRTRYMFDDMSSHGTFDDLRVKP